MAPEADPLFNRIWRSWQDVSERQASEFAASLRRSEGEAGEKGQPAEEHLRTWVWRRAPACVLFIEPRVTVPT